jgi:hypothetical protein
VAQVEFDLPIHVAYCIDPISLLVQETSPDRFACYAEAVESSEEQGKVILFKS